MNREYTELEMEVVLFSTDDVIEDSVEQIPVDSDMGEWLP